MTITEPPAHVTTEEWDAEHQRAIARCSCGEWERVFAVGGRPPIGYIDTERTARRCARVAALWHRINTSLK